MNSIITDLKNVIAGEVCHAPEILTEFSQDFGGIFHKHPQVIVRPRNVNDVVQTIKYARDQKVIISPRAKGHSLSGQSLNQDGIVLDMGSLNKIQKIDKNHLWFETQAGTSWGEVVNACVPHGLVPPVLTNYFGVSVGGTHSAGGLGGASFLYGSQADNCLGVEVVTADGEIVWCSPEENSELFHHVLCGFGQFGTITKVRHKLRKSCLFTRTYVLFYDGLEALLHDKQILVSEQRVNHLISFPVPSVAGLSRDTGTVKPLLQWFYALQISIETNDYENIGNRDILSGLNYYRHIHTEDLKFEEFIQPVIPVNNSRELVNPWIDILLPASKAQDYIENVLQELPSFMDVTKTPMGCFCLTKNQHKMPMFTLPDEELIIGFGIYPTLPKSQLQPVLKELKKFSDLSLEIGGKRYLTGLIEFDEHQWKMQFGDYWNTVNQMKHKYDPKGIFNPDFFQVQRKTKINLESTDLQFYRTNSQNLLPSLDLRLTPKLKYAIALLVISFTSVFWGFLMVNNFEILKAMLKS
jgi:hypothetical protein